jgi:hypothetical protein
VEEYLKTEPGSGTKYAHALLKVLNNISEVKVIEHTLDLVRAFLSSDILNRAQFFIDPNTGTPNLTSFLANIENDSAAVREASSMLLSLFLTIFPQMTTTMDQFVVWICEQLRAYQKKQDSSSLRSTMTSLTVLLSSEEAKLTFYKHGGLKLLAPYVQSAPGKATQLLYESTLCLWLLSMSSAVVKDIELQTLKDLSLLVAEKPREKVVRVAIATLRNVVVGSDRQKELCEFLQTTDLYKSLDQLKTSRTTDPEIAQDVKSLSEILENNYRVLSSVERYWKELQSGQLKWGNMHKDLFWKENIRQMENNDFAVVKRLVELLDVEKKNDEDLLTMAVACSDLGLFVQFYPNGKKIATTLGAKTKVMMFLDHKDEMVRKNALLCISKMLVSQWEFIEG